MIGDLLVPGVRRLRPDDHYMLLSETDASPLHIGALVLLDWPAAERGDFVPAMRRQLAERLPATPLLTRLAQAPDGYDSDVWAERADCDLDYHAAVISDTLDDAGLRRRVAALSTERLDLARAPFRAFLFDNLTDGRAAFYLKMHHALGDGIAFQTVLARLSDAAPIASPRVSDAALPDPARWHALAAARFAALEPAAAESKARRIEAQAALAALKADPATARARTPSLKLSGPIGTERAFAVLSLPFGPMRETARALGGTINDLFLAIGAQAIRATLIALGDLPDDPIVANSARSYRRAEHGDYGNRIVALHPHLATHIADPLERLRAIQAQMANERLRTVWDEALVDQPERPYGARDRRARAAAAQTSTTGAPARPLPGNVTLSNVPGPAEPLRYAGHAQIANYPVPIIGLGRWLNITSRRNAGQFDIGVMADPTRVADVDAVAKALMAAFDLYAGLAGRPDG